MPVEAATVSLTATNAATTSSFSSALSWSDGFAPSAANDYLVSGGFSLRTVEDGASATFAGNSLTLGDGATAGILVFKNQASGSVVTVNNLTLNNGEIQAGGTSTGAAHSVTLASNGITLGTGGSNRFNSGAAERSIIVSANISGSGSLVKNTAGVLVLSGVNNYTGGTTINTGALQFAKTVSMPATGAVSVAANSTLAVNIGGAGEFTGASTGAGSIGGLLAGVGANSVSLALPANASLGFDTTNSVGNVSYSGAFSSTNNLGLLKLGAGTLELNNGGTYAGFGAAGFPLVVRQGTLRLNGGTHSVTGELVVGGTFGTAAGATGQDAKLQVDSGALNVATWFSLGRGNGVGGVSSDLVLNDSATVTTLNLSAGFNAGSALNLPKGSITLNNNSTLNVTSTATGNAAGSATFVIGEYPGSDFTLTVNNNAVVNRSGGNIGMGNQAQGALQIGRDGKGAVIMNGGTINVASTDVGRGVSATSTQNGTLTINTGATYNNEGDFRVGFAGSGTGRGTVNLNGGTLNIGSTAARWLLLGCWDSSLSTINVNGGGNLNLNANSSIKFNQGAGIGAKAINLEAGGAITGYSDNHATALGSGAVDLMLSGAASSNNTFNLNGGALTIRQVISTTNNGARTFNFNGGTLRATGDTAAFVTLGTGSARANVRNGGAIIDTNGFTVTIPQALLHSNIDGDNAIDGGLTKQGAGTLTLTGANTYTGNTTINGGGLTISENTTLKFTIGANGVNNKVTGTGTVTLNGKFDIDVGTAGTTFGNSWSIVDVGTLNETFGATFGVNGFAANGTKWIKPANGTFYEFDTTTGLLRVIADPGISYPAPTVTLGRFADTVVIGSNIVLGVDASGTGNLTYQWYYQASVGSTPVAISGATGATLTVSNAGSSNTGIYSVIVTDHAAEASGQSPTTTTATFPLVSVVSASDAAVGYYRFEEGTAGAAVSAAVDSAPSAANPLTAGANAGLFSGDVAFANVPSSGAANTRSVDFGSANINSLLASTSGALANTEFKSFTVEAFVKFNTLDGVSTIVGRDDTPTDANGLTSINGQGVGPAALFYLQRSGNFLRVELIDRANVNLSVTSPNVTVANKWYHVAAVGDATTGTLSLYVDGVLAGSATGFTGLIVPPAGADAPWTVGRGDYRTGDTDPMRGLIDEVRISRAAIPPQHMLNSSGGVVIAPPTVTVTPSTLTVRPGATTTFTATATSNMGSTGAFSYQWYKDGVLLSGETNASATFTAGSSDTVYSVVATDPVSATVGSTVSTTVTARLRVIDVPAAGRAIGLNFSGASTGGNFSTASGALASATAAGFVPTANWNNSGLGVATQASAFTLAESNASTTASVSATWSSANTWAARTGTGDIVTNPGVKSPDGMLLHGYIETRSASGASVNLTNIPYGTYDVYVYVAGGTNGNVGSVSINGGASTYYYRVFQHDSYVLNPVPTAAGGYSPLAMVGEAADRAGALSAPPATFVRFAGVTGSDLAITAKDQTLNQNAGGIAAVQIVDTTPAGTAYPPIITTAPVSKLVKGGANVTFTVAATTQNSGGVLSYQWQKDGSPLSGQTSATLSLSNVTGASSGNYSVVVTDNSSLGASATTRTASLVVVDGTRSVLINADINAGGSESYVGDGILRADAQKLADGIGQGTTVWNGLTGGAGTATLGLAKESTGLSLPGLSFTYANAAGAEDNNVYDAISTSVSRGLMRDYLYTDDQATPLTATIGGLQAFAGHRFTLLVYAYGKQTNAQFEFSPAVTEDAASVTLNASNNHLSQTSQMTKPYLTGFSVDSAARRVEANNPMVTSGQGSAYVEFTGVVAADGTISWNMGPDGDAGRIPLNGFQLLLTSDNLAPAAPTGLAAVAGNAQVALSWNAVSGATTYTIRRGTASGVYTTISAGNVNGTSYTDTGLTNGTTYYYVVAAANGIVTSSGSNEVSATPANTTTAIQAWRQSNFGTTSNTGNAANTADPDNDGQSNLLEYALGTNPNTAGALPVTVARSGNFLTLAFNHIGDTTLVYKIEASNDLASWTEAISYTPFSTAGSTTYTDNVSLAGQPRRFLRLVVTAP